jgi:viroplasmin and RNaseH domain-containing protein
MATGLTNNEGWFERCFVSISQINGSEVETRTFTTNLSINGGNYDTESLETFGGTITRTQPYEDNEIELEGIPASTRDFDWLAHGVSPTSTTITSSTKVKTRVTFLWTDETGITGATSAIATASEAYRQIFADLYCTGVEYEMDAGEELTATINFKGSSEDADGVFNFKKEMCDTSSALAATPAYATGTKF